MSDDHSDSGAAAPTAKTDKDFGVDFEFDTEGIEPGLELDRSGFEEPVPEPAPPAPGPVGPVHAAGPDAPPPPPSLRPSPGQRPARPATQVPAPAPKPMMVQGIAVVAVLILLAIVGASFTKSEPEPTTPQVPQQALEEGERAIHQGKWIDALKAFKRLHRFPNSDEATAVRDRGLEEKAFNEIMKAEPTSSSLRRLEELSTLYPDRPEVRERLGEVRKALSSGARSAPAEEAEE